MRQSRIVVIQGFSAYFQVRPFHDVVIENPAGTNFYGAQVRGGSSLNLGDTKRRITNPGQPWGGNTGGGPVSDAGTLSAGANLAISATQARACSRTMTCHRTRPVQPIT